MDTMTITLTFQGWLPRLLRPAARHQPSCTHLLKRRASVKDVIESLGVPHTEVGAIRINNAETGFDSIVRDNDQITVSPLAPPVDVTRPTVLRPNPLPGPKFIADANVGKLASLLRMAGLDTAADNEAPDGELAFRARQEQRILLSKDIQLLKYKIIDHGHLVRESKPVRQLAEIVSFYGLVSKIVPFSRCMRCNEILTPVAKKDILHRLEPLTKKYYDDFHICLYCDKIYWPGSHKEKMREYLGAITSFQAKRTGLRS